MLVSRGAYNQGAYIWGGLIFGGLIFGILQYLGFPIIKKCKIRKAFAGQTVRFLSIFNLHKLLVFKPNLTLK